MALHPQTPRDHVTRVIGISALALALAGAYYIFPYAAREEQLASDLTRVAELKDANQRAARESASASIENLRVQAAESRSALLVMRRLVPTSHEVPALLEEVSTAARRAGLDVGGVMPQPVILGERFDTYRYTVTIIGGYHQLGEFLANVGSLARIVASVHVSIVAGARAIATHNAIKTSETGALTATIMLQAYVEKTPPAKPAAKESSS